VARASHAGLRTDILPLTYGRYAIGCGAVPLSPTGRERVGTLGSVQGLPCHGSPCALPGRPHLGMEFGVGDSGERVTRLNAESPRGVCNKHQQGCEPPSEGTTVRSHGKRFTISPVRGQSGSPTPSWILPHGTGQGPPGLDGFPSRVPSAHPHAICAIAPGHPPPPRNPHKFHPISWGTVHEASRRPCVSQRFEFTLAGYRRVPAVRRERMRTGTANLRHCKSSTRSSTATAHYYVMSTI
jgi:hypothetical protein